MSGLFEGRRVLSLGDADATLAVAQGAAATFAREGADLRAALLVRRDDAEPPSFRPEDLVEDRLFRNAHLVVAALSDESFRALFSAYEAADLARERSRPLVLAVDQPPAGAGAVDWLAARAPADVLGVRTEADAALYARVAATLGLDATNAAQTSAIEGLFGLSAALLTGQDMRESALPLRRSLAVRPAPPEPPSALAAGLARRLARKGRSAPQH